MHTGSHAASLAAVATGEADVAAIDSHLHAALGDDGLTVVERLGPVALAAAGGGPGAASGRARADHGDADRPGPRRARHHLGAGLPTPTYDPIRAMRAAAVARGGF